MKLKTRQATIIEHGDWDELVMNTYDRIYCFQQQDGCKPRGQESFTVPSEANDYENSTIPEVVNHPTMGVSFAAWLTRDPKKMLESDSEQYDWRRDLWWDRNFYPSLQMIANDLHAKGLLESGEYTINIDW